MPCSLWSQQTPSDAVYINHEAAEVANENERRLEQSLTTD